MANVFLTAQGQYADDEGQSTKIHCTMLLPDNPAINAALQRLADLDHLRLPDFGTDWSNLTPSDVDAIKTLSHNAEEARKEFWTLVFRAGDRELVQEHEPDDQG